MGHVTKRNLTISVPVLLETISVLEEWYQVEKVFKQLEYIMTGTDLVIGMTGPLRGHEILLADLDGTKKHLDSGCEEDSDVGPYMRCSKALKNHQVLRLKSF